MKDPAVLFYTKDFLTGTAFFTDAERGQYIRLLCEQHQNGHIPENHMVSVCFSLGSPVVKKFVKDEQGNYYNERMEEEIIKRRKFSESRYNNGKEGGRPKSIITPQKKEDLWQDMISYFDNTCICCGYKFDENNRPTKDHIIATSLGGIDDISNWQPLCRQCNSSKCADHKTDYRLRYFDKIPVKFKTIWFVKLKPLGYNNDNLIANGNGNVIVDIIEYLNKRSGKNFRSNSEKTQKAINARLNEKYSMDDFKKVIDIKCVKWLNDPKMIDYLRPETLFGTKFESYLNEVLINGSQKPKMVY
jgi:uncharacterized phage protein (TIGR02220 family)